MGPGANQGEQGDGATTNIHLAAGAIIAASAVAYAITPLTSLLAHRFGILDHPDERKGHAVATPYLGGAAIFCGLLAGGAFLLFVPDFPVGVLAVAVAGAVALGLLGLIDDVRPLPRALRLILQIGAAAAAYAVGFQVVLVPWEPLNAAITVVWIVGITNAFNLLDNMDGLSAGLAGIAALSIAVMALAEAQPALPILAAALAGASFGFLAHNRHPAKVFMGDAGSMFLGFLLALIGIQLRFGNLLQVTFLVPVVALGIPIFDTTLVVLSRLRHGRGAFEGGRDHVSHRLVAIGLPVKWAVRLLYFAGLCLGWLGLVVSRASPLVAWMLLTFVGALGLFFGALLWRVPVYPVDEGYAPGPREAEAIDPDELAKAAEEQPATPATRH